MEYGLPKSVCIGGEKFEIRYDYRVILDIFEVLNDADLNDNARAYTVLNMFYMDFDSLTDYEAAVKECFRFINGGSIEEKQKRRVQLMSWAQDFQYIVAPVNRVLGYEMRAIDYDFAENTGGIHWWTFLSAYLEIGDCLFAQIVRIRELKSKGKPLDKQDREFYRNNRDIIDLKVKVSDAENELIKQWTGKAR